MIKSEQPDNSEQLFLQRSADPNQQQRLNERSRNAVRLIREGIIGNIDGIDFDLKGKWVTCIGGQYPFEIALRIEDINPDNRTVLIEAGTFGKKWVPINDLRFLSAVSSIINASLDPDPDLN